MAEHKIEQYADLTAIIAEITAANEQAADSIKAVEKQLADMAVLIKNVKEYDVIKRNIDSILRQDKEPEYNKEATRE